MTHLRTKESGTPINFFASSLVVFIHQPKRPRQMTPETQYTSGEAVAARWDNVRQNKWIPLHPEWHVRMLRKGEPLQRGDFYLTASNGGQALHFSVSAYETVGRTGDTFRYEIRWPFHLDVALSDILEWVEQQQRELFHQARLELIELAVKYRESVGIEDRYNRYRDIMAYMDTANFGDCKVVFDEDGGDVIFLEEGSTDS